MIAWHPYNILKSLISWEKKTCAAFFIWWIKLIDYPRFLVVGAYAPPPPRGASAPKHFPFVLGSWVTCVSHLTSYAVVLIINMIKQRALHGESAAQSDRLHFLIMIQVQPAPRNSHLWVYTSHASDAGALHSLRSLCTAYGNPGNIHAAKTRSGKAAPTVLNLHT